MNKGKDGKKSNTSCTPRYTKASANNQEQFIENKEELDTQDASRKLLQMTNKA